MNKNIRLEIKKDLKTLKFNRPYLTNNQLIATVCAMQDIKRNKHINFKDVE